MVVTIYYAVQSTALRYPHLPCLHVGKKNRTVYLPMEVCQIVNGQQAFHQLTDQQTTEMRKQTIMEPRDKFRKIQEIVSSFSSF